MSRIQNQLSRLPIYLLLLALSSCALFSKAPVHSATAPEPRQDEWWQKRHASFNERAAQGDVDLVFIGDSITQGWEGGGKDFWAKYYTPRKAMNLGISGDRTQHVLWRLQNGNIKGISPKAAIIMIGTNNYKDNTPQEIADGIHEIIRLLRKELPQMKILVLAIFPRAEKKDSPDRIKLDEVNALVKKFAKGRKVEFLDIGAKFLDAEGNIPKEIMPDFLHPNTRGYEIWAEAIEPNVKSLLGE